MATPSGPTQVTNLGVTLSVQDGKFVLTMREADKVTNLLDGSLESLGQALNKVQGLFGETAKNSQSFVSSFSGAEAAAAAFGASAGLAFNRALDSFVEFENGVVAVQKVVEQLTGNTLERFKTDMLQLSTVIPLASTELLKIAQNLGQLGFFAKNTSTDINDSVNLVVELVGKIGASTDLSAEEAGNAFGTLRNIFLATETDTKRINNELTKFVNTAVELSNVTSATTGDIIRFNNRIGATATALGLSFNQISAYGAAVRQLGQTSEVGATALQGLLNQLTTKASVFANALNITTEEFRKLVRSDPNDALLKFFTKLNSLTAEQRTLTLAAIDSDARFTTVVQGLASNVALITDAQNAANRAAREGIAVNNQAEKVFGTLDAQLKLFANNLQNAFGQGFGFIADGFKETLTVFNQLGAAAPTLLAAFAGITTVAAGMLAALTAIGLVVPKVKLGFEAIKGTAVSSATSFNAFSKALFTGRSEAIAFGQAMLALPAKIRAVGVAATASSVALVTMNRALTFVKTTGASIGASAGSLVVGLGLIDAVSKAVELSSTVKEIKRELATAISSENFNSILNTADSAITKLKEQASIVADIFTLGVTAIKRNNAISDLEAIKQNAKDVLELQKNAFNNFLSLRDQRAGNAEGQQLFAATAEALEKSFAKLGDQGLALDLVLGNSFENITKLRKEFGLSDAAALSLAKRLDDINGVSAASADSAVRKLKAQLDTTQERLRVMKDIVDTEALLRAELEKQKALRADAVKTVTDIANKSSSLAGDEAKRVKRMQDLKNALDAQKILLEQQAEAVKLQLKELGATVTVFEDGSIVLGNQKNVQAQNLKLVKQYAETLERITTDTAKLDKDRKASMKVLNDAETTYQKTLRETKKEMDELNIATRERAVNDAAANAKAQIDENDSAALLNIERTRVRALLELEKEKADILLRELEAKRKADGEIAESDEVAQLKRQAILTKSSQAQAAILNDFYNQQIEAAKQNNKELDSILREAKFANTTGPNGVALNRDAAKAINDQFEEMKRVNALIADEEKKRLAIAAILRNIKQIIKETVDAELKAKRELEEFDRKRAQEERDRLQRAKQAADTELLTAKQAANLRSDAGKRQLEAARIAAELAKGIAEREKDGVLTAQEISEIENARIKAAEASARVTGQLNSEAGRKQLADTIERIRLEAQQLRERERTQQGMTREELDAAEKAALIKNQQQVKGEKGLTDQERLDKLKELNKQTEEFFKKQREELAVREDGNAKDKERLELVERIKEAAFARNAAVEEENRLLGETKKRLEEILATEGAITAERQGRVAQETALGGTQSPVENALPELPAGQNPPNAALPTPTQPATVPPQIATTLTNSLANTERAAQAATGALEAASASILVAADKVTSSLDSFKTGVGTFVNKTVNSLENLATGMSKANADIAEANSRLTEIESAIVAQED